MDKTEDLELTPLLDGDGNLVIRTIIEMNLVFAGDEFGANSWLYQIEVDRPYSPNPKKPNRLSTRLFQGEREIKLFDGYSLPVTVSIGKDPQGNIRPIEVIEPTPVGLEAETATVGLNPTSEPTFTIGQQIITTADIPIGESGKAPAGESGTVVEIVTSTDPNCGRIIGAWLPNWGKVSAAPTSFKVDADVEGVDSGVVSEVADLQRRIDGLTFNNGALIKLNHDLGDMLNKAEETIVTLEAEAQEHTAPLPTSVKLYEHLTIWDTSDAKQDEMDNAGWERIHTQGMTCEGGVNRLLTIWRREKTNGTPKPTMIEVASIKDVAEVTGISVGVN